MKNRFALLPVLFACAATASCQATHSTSPANADDRPASARTTGYPDFAVPRLEGRPDPALPPITGRIHVDQFGYLPREAKVAVISDPQNGYNAADAYRPGAELVVRRKSDGTVVFRGAPKPWREGAVHEDSGDRGWWLDFSSVTAPGEYYIFDEANDRRSPVFRVASDVYRDVLRAAVRTFFYQRLSWKFEKPHAEEPWLLPAYKNEDRKARALWAKDDPKTERNLAGGWMDAGDTNKYPPFNADALSSLLYAYRANPKLFGDDYNIPESGNGLPDMLDELKYQFDWLLKMQDSDGGVFIKMGELRDKKVWKGRYYGPKDTGATITSCMNYAHGARVFGKFPIWAGYAEQLLDRAERAWKYYRSHPRTHNLDTGEIAAGIANKNPADQDRLEAAAAFHLWILTRKPEYHAALKAKAGAYDQLRKGYWDPYNAGIAETLVEYAAHPDADASLKQQILQSLRSSAKHASFAPPVEEDLYRAWMNREAYHWGSSTVRAAFGFSALLAAETEGVPTVERDRLRQRARDLLHSFHGVNPLSMVFLTNMSRHGAELSAKRIWHERFNYDTPLAETPPPGYIVGGPNQQFGGVNGDRPGDVEWIKKQPRAKAYADFNETWPKNSWEITENAIYYQAAYIRLLSGVMGLESRGE